MTSPLQRRAYFWPLLALLLVPVAAQAQSTATIYRATFYADSSSTETGGALAHFDGTYVRVAGFFSGLNSGWRSVDLLNGSPESQYTLITDVYAPPPSGPNTDGFYLADALSQAEAEALASGGVYLNVITVDQNGGEVAAQFQPFGEDLEVFHATLTRLLTEDTVDDVGFFIGALDDTTLHLSGGFTRLHSSWSAIHLITSDASGTPDTLTTFYPGSEPSESGGGLHTSVALTAEAAASLRAGQVAVSIATTVQPWGEVTSSLLPVQTGTGKEDEHENRSTVGAAFPNPFTGSTRLNYTLARPGHVSIAAYDVLGRRVATLFEGPQTAGPHTATFDAAGLPSGHYLVRVESPGQAATQTVTLVR